MAPTPEADRLAVAVDALTAKAERLVDTLASVDRSQALTQQRVDLLVPDVACNTRDVRELRAIVERGRGAQWAVTVVVGLLGLALVVLRILDMVG